jgi:hypothetical protein
MDIKQLIEKMDQFAGQAVGQKPGNQWKGTDKGTPGKKLVGDSILKDLSKGKKAKSREQELAEEWANFNEEDLGTHPKRPGRKSDRHSRGHEPQPRYKTVKADEGLENPHPASKDPIVAKVVKQMRPGLKNLDMGNEAFLYFAYELGKQRARDSWEDYLPAIRSAYEQGLSEDANTDNKLAKLLTRFINQNEGAGHAVASDAIEYIKKIGHIEQFATSLDYFGVDLDEGWESGPEEYEEPYDDADDAYDAQRQEKIDTEAEREWDKLPKVSTYKLVGRGPNMEPNHEFGDEFDTLEQALEYRAEIMKDPKTPNPEHIGIRTLTRIKDQTNEARDSDIVQPLGQDSFNRGGFTPIRDQTDYLKRRSEAWNLLNASNTDPQTKAEAKQQILDLDKQARAKGFTQVESRGHTIIANKLKDIERAKKFASGELKVPTPQERQAQLKQLEKPKKQIKEFGANNPPQNTVEPAMQQQDPKQAQAVAQATQAMKSATGSSAPTATLAKALDTASQGKPVAGQEAAALEPLMKDMATVAQDPKLAGSFKSLVSQINQAQIKQQQTT